jgi:hypothetical protein
MIETEMKFLHTGLYKTCMGFLDSCGYGKWEVPMENGYFTAREIKTFLS